MNGVFLGAMIGAGLCFASCGKSNSSVSQAALDAVQDSTVEETTDSAAAPEPAAPAAPEAAPAPAPAPAVVDDPLAEQYIGRYGGGGGHSGFSVKVYKTEQGIFADLQGQDCYGETYATRRMKVSSIDGGIIMSKGGERHVLNGPYEDGGCTFDDDQVTRS